MFLVLEEKDLYVPLDKDHFLIRFLRPCKYYAESARDLVRRFGKVSIFKSICMFLQVKKYYAFKIKHAVHYDNLLPSTERNVFNQNIITVMPNRDQFGRRIVIIDIGSEYYIIT